METGSCNELWHLQVSEVSLCYSDTKGGRPFWTNNRQIFWNDGPTVQELLQTVQGNGSCSWNSLKRTLLFTLTFWTDLDQVNFSFCTGNKVPLFSKVCIPVFLTGVCQHRPCIAVKIPLLLNTWSKFCSACENVFSFIHLDTQQIRMCMEKHHCRLSNIQE